jgi:hypothetical protein
MEATCDYSMIVSLSLPFLAFGRWVGAVAGSLAAPVTGSIHDDLVAVVREAIERALGEDRVIEEGNPFLDGAVGGDDGRSSPVSLDDDLIEIAGLLGIEASESEVVDDEEVGREEIAQDSLGGVVGTRLVDRLEQVIAAQEEDTAAGVASRGWIKLVRNPRESGSSS